MYTQPKCRTVTALPVTATYWKRALRHPGARNDTFSCHFTAD